MKDTIINLLKKYASHNFIKLTSRGNTAIFSALYCARKIAGIKPILTTEQGGWISYIKYPKMLQMDVKLCRTDNALIDLEDLKKKSKNCAAFIYSHPGGYFVEQPAKEIYRICKKNNCMVIMDVTGSIGTSQCNGKYVDFMVCSFGSNKPINLGYGGFISAEKEEYFESPKEIFNTDKFEAGKLPLLLIKLKELKERHKMFSKANRKIKQDLKNFDIIHKNKRGINVMVKFSSEEEKGRIIEYCKKNSFKYRICRKVPDSTKNLFSFIKVNEDAVSIEVQRL